MALLFSYEKKEDIPQGLESHYVEQEGKFVLDVSGAVSDEEHERTKAAYLKRIEEAKGKNKGGLTAEEVQAMIAEAVSGKPKPKPNENDSELARRLKALEDEKADRAKELEGAKSALTNERIHTQLLTAATAAGVRPESIELIVREASRYVVLSDSNEVRTAVDSAFGSDLTAAQLIAKMKESPSYKLFWPASQGGGGKPGGGKPNGAGDDANPWMAEQWNVTAQQRILGDDFEKGKQLAAAAKIGIYDNLAKARRAQQG